MVQNAKSVGDRVYRESFGRYFEDFEVGDIYQHRPGRTINETDNTWFTLLTMNTHPLHFDREYAAASEFGQILVNSAFTVALVVGMSVSDVSQKAIANLGATPGAGTAAAAASTPAASPSVVAPATTGGAALPPSVPSPSPTASSTIAKATRTGVS